MTIIVYSDYKGRHCMPERLSVIFIIIKISEWLNLTSVVKQHVIHSLVARKFANIYRYDPIDLTV
jgi:hypothetical protein